MMYSHVIEKLLIGDICQNKNRVNNEKHGEQKTLSLI